MIGMKQTVLRIARVRFRGIAQRWAQPRQFQDWDDFERQFLERFGETPETAMVRLENCYQKQGESPKNFADRFLEEAERAGRRTDTALLHQFIRRLHPELRLEVTRQRPVTMEDAIEFCNYWTGANSELGAEEYPNPSRQRSSTTQNGPYQKPEQGNRPPPFARRQDDRPFRIPPWRPQQSNERNGGQNRPPWANRNGQYPQRNDNQQRPFNPGANHNRPGQVSNNAVDELTRQMEKMQINLRQADALREAQQQEISRLKAALRRPNDNIQLMETAAYEHYDYAPYEEYYDYDDELMAKRSSPEDEDTTYVRMPHKRVAITPAGQSPYMAPRRVSPPPPPAAASPKPS